MRINKIINLKLLLSSRQTDDTTVSIVTQILMPQTGYQNTKYYTRIPLIGRTNVQHVGSASDTVRRRNDGGINESSALAEKSVQRTIQQRRRRSIVGVTDNSRPLHCGWRRRRDESDVGLIRRSTFSDVQDGYSWLLPD